MTTTTPAQRYVSLKESAAYLGVTERTIRNFIARGEIPAYRIGSRAIRIDRGDLDRIITPVPTVGTAA